MYIQHVTYLRYVDSQLGSGREWDGGMGRGVMIDLPGTEPRESGLDLLAGTPAVLKPNFSLDGN